MKFIVSIFASLVMALAMMSPASGTPATAAYNEVVNSQGCQPNAQYSGQDTYIIGDSITYRGSNPHLKDIRPNWCYDAIGGSPVNSLPSRVQEMATTVGYSRNIILAMGTNPSDNWNKQNYINVVDSIPTTSNVILVTCYRGYKAGGERWGGAEQVDQYSEWMNEIASTRPNVTVLKWKWHVLRGAVVLSDGIHARPDDGEIFWANMINDGVKSLQ